MEETPLIITYDSGTASGDKPCLVVTRSCPYLQTRLLVNTFFGQAAINLYKMLTEQVKRN